MLSDNKTLDKSQHPAGRTPMTMCRRMMISASLLACLASPAFLNPAAAQAWPAKPVKIIVPATPGGAIDVIARMLADKLPAGLGQPVIVENKPGAANNLGTDFVAKSAPDGYTFVIVASSHATNKFLYKDLGWDPITSFEPVAYTHVVPLVLAVHPSIPAKTVEEFSAWAKANPDKAIYGSSGSGSSLHMSAELYQAMSGVKLPTHVTYKGSSAIHPDLIGGRLAATFDTVTAIQGHVKSGAVRGIAVTTLQKSSALPDLPTISDSGLKGYDSSTWGGILAPKGTPKDIVDRMNAEINKVLASADVREKLVANGIEVQKGTPQDFAAVISREVNKWGEVIAKANIKPE